MVLRLDERRRLARSGDESMSATAHRLRSARFVAGVSQVQIARFGWASPDLVHVEDAEAGRVMPNYALLNFYWRRLRLTADFFETGKIHEIRVEIEDRLFAALKAQME
ncbi:hypothetical protein [Maritimibacter sp. 55A14]|uniref:hypothetical protein n=1 Tax=Maritimibacter sp. 55A14 TaxID=2174844 RepID=UPI0011B25E33|nr:hypothetical protein [Maritimibacter sp. 55A14]